MMYFLRAAMVVGTFWLALLSPPAHAQASKHDCAIFYMGAGGYMFAAALSTRADEFRRANPKAYVDIRHHWSTAAVPVCKNPLIVGHSLGAIKAVKVGNALRKGRVISIDPPDWYTRAYGLRANQPTMNFFHCPASPYGCGRVSGSAQNVDLSKEGLTHVFLPYSRTIAREVMR